MDLLSEIKKENKLALAKAITLLESTNAADQNKAQKLIYECKKNSGRSIRIGITGIPGVGKSTFIESFGKLLTNNNKKVAVLAIDPSSKKTKGSILGDKSRMHELAIDKNAFIRPSPNSGTLGGVANKTRESIILCEAAGFNVILIETVGVGQSEIDINNLVDFTLLLMISGAGDELQGIKRGIIEIADAIIINKADGKNEERAKQTAIQYKNAINLLNINRKHPIQVSVCSALENIGIKSIWKMIERYQEEIKKEKKLFKNRSQQDIYWLHKILKEELGMKNYRIIINSQKIKEIEKKLLQGENTIYQIIEKI